ncbi:hypothetical protein [Brevibacillus choshinensis]|uniref:hypothetical protein n=1 Tax=Brevibacillus choshinensis TaxID=54911 RepID=UPI000B17BD59|nr:hypothetical protein [Brevibacillus choshinensis]MED4584262.1 hypothetical protein [Brevibacillus choshinensis]MED4755137.1 hypothetical protein [Brevibacillus choshinensis]MED4784195.1 hypothetical protein [Brevibacillus choshinensis]
MKRQPQLGKELNEKTGGGEGVANRIEEQDEIEEQDNIEAVYGIEDNDEYAG